MKIKNILTTLILGVCLLSFGRFAHAEEYHNNDIHNHDSDVHNHDELMESGNIAPMYIPCPVADPNPHAMIFMSSYEVYKGQTGSYHYHGNRYCVAELYLVRSLYSCKYCGWDEWRESSRIIHPGL